LSKLEEIVLDFTKLDEAPMFLMQQGAQLERVLNVLFTGSPFPVKVRGTGKQLDRFAQALAAEKTYAAAFNKYGLDNPATYRSKYRLGSAVNKFERDTGLVWPVR
jgi:hypothetical protein